MRRQTLSEYLKVLSDHDGPLSADAAVRLTLEYFQQELFPGGWLDAADAMDRALIKKWPELKGKGVYRLTKENRKVREDAFAAWLIKRVKEEVGG